jgi:DNA-binding transcriptional MerR regulator
MMAADRSVTETAPLVFRIGEVAKLTGLTTRTLRYWEELGLVAPSSYGSSGDRHYTAAEMARVLRIRDLQKLLGFSLAEVRVVLDTEEIEVLDRIRSELRTELRSGDPTPTREHALIEEAIEANDHLLARLDDTLSRIEAFRAERVASAGRLRARLQTLETDAQKNPETPTTSDVPRKGRSE